MRMSTGGLALAFAASALAIPLTAYAGSPLKGISSTSGYDDWQVTTGPGEYASGGYIDSSSSCSAPNITCTEMSRDIGFLQERVNNSATGQQFVRVIMVDDANTKNAGNETITGAPAVLAFTNETFVPLYSDNLCSSVYPGALAERCQGIAAKQVVRDTADGFVSAAELQRNFANINETNPANQFVIKLHQEIVNSDMNYAFDYRQWQEWNCTSSGGYTCNATKEIGHKTDIDMTVFTGDPLNPLDTTKERFVQHQRQGKMGRNSFWCGSNSCRATIAGNMDLDGAGTAYTPVSWANEANIAVTWIAANNQAGFAFESIKNKSTAAYSARNELYLVEPINPFGTWNATNFGAAPSFF